MHVTPADFTLEVDPTLLDKLFEEDIKKHVWTYALNHNKNGNSRPIGWGYYPHSKFKYLEKRSIKETMIENLSLKLNPDLLEDIIDIYFLRTKQTKNTEESIK